MISKATVKYILSLKDRSGREEANAFVAEGPKVVEELLTAGLKPEFIFATEKGLNTCELSNGGQIVPVSEEELKKISFLSTPHSVLAVFKKPVQAAVETKHKITLVLDTVQDPGNLGTIIRTADWFGVENIVCSWDTVDNFNPKVVQSTMASIARVNIFYTNLTQWLPAQTVRKYAATLDGTETALQKTEECILIMGNESQGISPELLQYADEHITIPKIGGAESLNVAIATGILLHGLCV